LGRYEVTGAIEELNSHRRSGSIRADDGRLFTFFDSAVLGEQFDFLKLGQHVSFETGLGEELRNADRVRAKITRAGAPSPVITAERPVASPVASGAPAHFLYTGFDQPKGVRHYKFSSVAHGQATIEFIVSVDMALFLKHRVGIQEGPGLCLRKLAQAIPHASPMQGQLTEGDVVAYVSDRAAAVARNLERRGRWKPRKAVAVA
jgi:hypothetical protein